YRLLTGVPGRSNALAIAGRLGMPREILAAASTLLDPDELRIDSLLQDIRQRREEADAFLERARNAEEAARQAREAAERELSAAEHGGQGARIEALAEAEIELEEARDALKRLQRDRETLQLTRDHLEQRRREVDQAADRVRTFRRERVARPRPAPGKKPI